MITDGELDNRMSRADPARTLNPSVDALAELLRQTAPPGASASRQRRRMFTSMSIAGALAIAAVALPAAAAVRILSEHTWTCESGTECVEPGGQWIDTGAADFVEYSATVFPRNLPLPSGVDADTLRVDAATRMHQNPGLQEEIGVVRAFENAIYCAWVTEWLISDETGDLAARNAAATVMVEAAGWPAYVATDGGGLAERQRVLGAAALGGDRNAVRMAAQINSCSLAEASPRSLGYPGERSATDTRL